MTMPKLVFHRKQQDDIDYEGRMDVVVVCHLRTANRSTRLFGLFRYPQPPNGSGGYQADFGGVYFRSALRQAGRDVFEHFFGNGVV